MNLCSIHHRLQCVHAVPIYLYSYAHLFLFLCCSILYMPQCSGEDEVYVSASFKTWLLSDNFLWNYSPNRIREEHPEIQSHYLKKQQNGEKSYSSPTYEDINVFIEHLPLDEIAALCYDKPGEIYMIPGDRHEIQLPDGLIAGKYTFLPNQPARFVTKSQGVDLSILMSNIFLLYQLYIDKQIEKVHKGNIWHFRWANKAYDQAKNNDGDTFNSPSIKEHLKILTWIKRPTTVTSLPAISYQFKSAQERVLIKRDELRGIEGAAIEGQPHFSEPYESTWPALYADIGGKTSGLPPIKEDKKGREYLYEAFIGKKVASSGLPRVVITKEIWVVDPAIYFTAMKYDRLHKSTDSIVRYEFFSCHADVVQYYHDHGIEMRKVFPHYKERTPKLIYRSK